MEPQVAAAAGGDAMTKMMSSFWGSLVRRPCDARPMAKSGHTTLEPFRSLLAFAASADDSSAVWTSIGQ